MKIREIVEQLGLTILSGSKEQLEYAVSGGYVSDLLSNVMGQAKEKNIWITMQGHQNIIAVASLLGLSAVILAGGSSPDEETLAKAKSQDIPLMVTELSSFEVAGRLYQLGVGSR